MRFLPRKTRILSKNRLGRHSSDRPCLGESPLKKFYLTDSFGKRPRIVARLERLPALIFRLDDLRVNTANLTDGLGQRYEFGRLLVPIIGVVPAS